MRQEGKIQYYGISSYAGFRVSHKEPHYIGLDEMVQLAEKVGGKDHGLRYLCMPLNIVMMEPLLEKHQTTLKSAQGDSKEVIFKSTLEKANELKLNVMTASPFLSGFLLQTPLPTTILRNRYIPVKHMNLIRYARPDLAPCLWNASSQ